MPSLTRAEVGARATSVGARNTLRVDTVACLCRSLKHRTRDCERREAEKGVIPAKQNVLAKGPTAAIKVAARGDRKEEWNRTPVQHSTCPIHEPE